MDGDDRSSDDSVISAKEENIETEQGPADVDTPGDIRIAEEYLEGEEDADADHPLHELFDIYRALKKQAKLVVGIYEMKKWNNSLYHYSKDASKALLEACKSDYVSCFTVVELLESGADPNIRCKSLHNTPLHWLARRGNGAPVSLLIQAGADINAVNYRHATPLMEACDSRISGRASVVRELLKQVRAAHCCQ